MQIDNRNSIVNPDIQADLQQLRSQVQAIQAVTIANPYLTQATWFISPATGSDSNSGLTSLVPLKTFAELSRRWGTFNRLTPPGSSPSVVVTLMDSVPFGTDPIQFRTCLGPSTSILFVGTGTTVIASGTFTGVTAKVRATNTPLQVADTSILGGSWAPYLFNGATPARIHDTTNGSVFWPVKDLGAETARCSEPITPIANAATSNYPTLNNSNRPGAAVTIGDAYQLQLLTQCQIGQIAVIGSRSEGTAVNGENSSTVAFQDLQLNRSAAGQEENFTQLGCSIAFYGCFNGMGFNMEGGGLSLYYTAQRRIIDGEMGFCHIQASALFATWTVSSSSWTLDMDTLFQGSGAGSATLGVLSSVTCKIGTCAFFDCVSGPNNPDGAGVHVMPGGSVQNVTFTDITHAVWGSGNAGAGISVGNNGTWAYQTNVPTVTGSTPGTNDFTLSGATTSRCWQEGGSAFSALQTNTWTGFAAAFATGGTASNVCAQNVGTGAKLGQGV